jgi:hypothetical protein
LEVGVFVGVEVGDLVRCRSRSLRWFLCWSGSRCFSWFLCRCFSWFLCRCFSWSRHWCRHRGFAGILVVFVVRALVGVEVGVLGGIIVGVEVGVFVGDFVGVFVGAEVGVLVGVFVGRRSLFVNKCN